MSTVNSPNTPSVLLTSTNVRNHKVNHVVNYYAGAKQASDRTCPLCGCSLIRARRRPIDRFISVFHRVYRYRCYAADCSWEGNLPTVSIIDSKIHI
jgi:hypothetical protein